MFVGFSAAMHSGAPQIYLFRISTGAYFIDNNKKIKTADIYRIYGIFHFIIQVGALCDNIITKSSILDAVAVPNSPLTCP